MPGRMLSTSGDRVRWSLVAESLNRSYPVTLSMVLLVSLVPLYIFIADVARDGTPHVPELPLDRAFPLQPAWSMVYGRFARRPNEPE